MKKKAVSMILCMTMALSLAACGSQSASGQADSSADAQTQTDTGEDTQADAGADDTADTAGSGTGAADAAGGETEASGSTALSDGTGSNILIAYFSWSGNTEELAGMIQSETSGELFEIEPAEPYTEDYDALFANILSTGDTILKKTGYLIKNRGNFCSGVRIDDSGKLDRKGCRNTVFVSGKQSFSKCSLCWVPVNWFSSKSRENSRVIHCGTHFMHTLSCSNNSVDESLFVGLQGVHPVDKDRPERNFS